MLPREELESEEAAFAERPLPAIADDVIAADVVPCCRELA
jgi:hypothetical protein